MRSLDNAVAYSPNKSIDTGNKIQCTKWQITALTV
jgi:hypothetical protein